MGKADITFFVSTTILLLAIMIMSLFSSYSSNKDMGFIFDHFDENNIVVSDVKQRKNESYLVELLDGEVVVVEIQDGKVVQITQNKGG